MILNKKDYVDKAQKVMDKLQSDRRFTLQRQRYVDC